MENKSPRIKVPIIIPYHFIIKSQMSLWKANRCKSKRKTDYRASKYSVEIIRKQNEFYVNITFDETEIGRTRFQGNTTIRCNCRN